MSPKTTNTNEPTSQPIGFQRARRHWYPHEKVEILNAYDNMKLKYDSKKKNHVIDSKTNESIPILLIERWRDHLRALGLIQGMKEDKASSKTVPIKETLPENKSNLQELVIDLAVQNRELQRRLEALESKKPATRSAKSSEVRI